MNNGLDTIGFTIAFINLSGFDYRFKHADITSSAAPRLKKFIMIVSRNLTDAVLIPFEATLLPS